MKFGTVLKIVTIVALGILFLPSTKVLALDFDELGRFVDSIARAAEKPDMRPLCKR